MQARTTRWLLLLALVLLAAPTWSATYYTAISGGNNANPGGPTTPFQTITKGISVLTAGDTLFIRQGTYNENISNTNGPIASGTSESTRVTIAGDPADPPLSVIITGGVQLNNGTGSWITFNNLVFDALTSDTAFYFGGDTSNTHIRVSNSELRNAQCNGGAGMIAGKGDYFELLGNKIHDAGIGNTAFPQGCYATYLTGSNMIIDGNESYNNAGYGILVYHSGVIDVYNNIVRNNVVHNNCFNDGARGNGIDAVLVASGGNDKIYNNIIYNNTCFGGGSALNLYIVDTVQVYHNTITGNNGIGINVQPSVTNTTVRNNIVYNNGGGITNDGPGGVQSNNLTTDPLFSGGSGAVCSGTGPYTLQSTSAARNAGFALSTVPTDICGVARPQPAGGAWDIGAYEAGGGGGPTPGPQALRWKFDEGTGAITADATGNGYVGSLVASPTWSTGRVGAGSLLFNGTTQYVSNASITWQVNQPVTVVLWVKKMVGTASGALGFHNTGVDDRFGAHLPYSDNVVYFDYGNWHGAGRISADFTPYLTRWTHVALVSAGPLGAFKAIYFNGVQVASASVSSGPTVPLTAFDVGRWVVESGTLYDPGAYDDVRIENRVWTPAEILNDYRQATSASTRHKATVQR